MHQKLVYLQGCLPYLRAMEKDPKYVKKGPSSRDVELLMQQYVPEKAADPGSLFLEINFANGYTSQGLIDFGASCSIMPLSIYQKAGLPKLKSSNAYLTRMDGTKNIAMTIT